MGCCSSSYAAASVNFNGTYDGYYVESPERTASKRSYASRISTGSSGVSSRCTTPSRRSLLSHCTTSMQLSPAPKPKSSNLTCHKKDMPKAFEMLSICDDFCEGPQLQQQQQQEELDKSYGYFTASMSTGSSDGHNSSNNDEASTPAKSSNLKHTQDTSEHTDMPMDGPTSDLEMEMFMMTHSQTLMPKTSSPLCQRRDMTFAMPANSVAATQSHSYQKWSNYLQSTPAYMLHNVTNIPEAIAGQFSPLDFPGFSDLAEMDSAAKRYKVDVNVEDALQPVIGVTQTIISTDL